MRRIGDTFDAITAFLGSAVAGIALFLPITFPGTPDSAPYRIESLINSVPRGAAVGMIVAVAVAVVVTTFTGQGVAWTVALAAGFTMFVNHVAGRNVSSTDMLTTQNYLDAVCGGILLGALGAAALRRPIPAIGFAFGSATFFLYRNTAQLLDLADDDPYGVLETPPRWLIGVTLFLLILSAMHNRSHAMEPRSLRLPTELPVAPILAAMVLALVSLAVFEWLTRQYRTGPDAAHAVDIGLTVAATMFAATAAAFLLPGRDGRCVYLAVSLTATNDALGYVRWPAWGVLILLALTGLGLMAGTRLRAVSLSIISIMGLAVLAIPQVTHDNRFVFVVATAVLAFTAGYSFAAAFPSYAPSGVLAIAVLFLPSIIMALPEEHQWTAGYVSNHQPGPGRTALALTICCAVGLIALHRIRPRTKVKTDVPIAAETVADT